MPQINLVWVSVEVDDVSVECKGCLPLTPGGIDKAARIVSWIAIACGFAKLGNAVSEKNIRVKNCIFCGDEMVTVVWIVKLP